MLPSYFDHILEHLRQKARPRPKLSPKYLSNLGQSLAQTRLEPKPDLKIPAQLTTLKSTGLEDETPNHHVGNCKFHQDIPVKYFELTKTTHCSQCDVNKLATFLKEATRLSEFDQ